MKLKQVRTGKDVMVHSPIMFMAQDREIVEEAGPGDVIGVPNHGTVRVGDTFTEGEVFLLPSSGSGAIEASVRNCIGKDDKVLCLSNGAFGDKFYDTCIENNKNAVLKSFEWGKAVEPGIVKEELEKGEYKAVTLVHNETSTGLLNPIYEISRVIRDFDVMFLVDAVSSMGGAKIEIDKLGIDVCSYGSQKCLALPPGLGISSVSELALGKSETVKNRGYYFDYNKYRKYSLKNQTPTTPAVSQIMALRERLNDIIGMGIENLWKDHQNKNSLIKKAALKMGFGLFPEEKYSSPVLNCLRTGKVTPEEILAKMKEKEMILASGYGKIKAETIRIGNMGDINYSDIELMLEELAKVVE